MYIYIYIVRVKNSLVYVAVHHEKFVRDFAKASEKETKIMCAKKVFLNIYSSSEKELREV